MPGARFQSAARVRNSYPHGVSYGIRTQLTVASVAADVETPFVLPASVQIPFDVGPDKAPFVGVTINGSLLTFSSSGFVALTVSGAIYHRSPEGRKTYLAVLNNVYTALETASGSTLLERSFNGPIALPTYVANEVQASIGVIGFENLASALGGQTLTFSLYTNVGLYPVYAEQDWVQTICDAIKEVQTPQWAKDDIKNGGSY